jgi:uncharacterized protein YciI
MKVMFILAMLLPGAFASAQSNLPEFLQGTWKVENKEVYEHWDKINEASFKGMSYSLEGGKMAISEYLDIAEIDNEVIYTATVLHQNQGEGIQFKLLTTDSTYSFVNHNHDFPKEIVYQKLSESEVIVHLSDGNERGFAYKMHKLIRRAASNVQNGSNPNFDPILAQKFGADAFGMKSYVLVILRSGNNQSTDMAMINNSFRGHMDNINLLVKEGKMIVAGPLQKNENSYRGIFILDVAEFDEAEILLQNDTAIKDGFLDYELYKWYGSAALQAHLEFADKIWKDKP